MSDLIERLRKEAAERAKEPGWFDEQLSQDIAAAADVLESRDRTIAELVAAIDGGVQVSTPELMEWIADRMVFVYNESPNVDYVQSLRSRAQKLRLASSQAQSKDKAE
jgi:beta-xylosidase